MGGESGTPQVTTPAEMLWFARELLPIGAAAWYPGRVLPGDKRRLEVLAMWKFSLREMLLLFTLACVGLAFAIDHSVLSHQLATNVNSEFAMAT